MTNSNTSPKLTPSSRKNDAYWESLFGQMPEENLEENISANIPTEILNNLPDPQQNGLYNPANHLLWQKAEEAYEKDELLQLPVVGYNKGGVLVDWNGLQGFVPASQLLNMPHFHIEMERVRALEERQNEMLNLKIIELNRSANRLILSERVAQVPAGNRRNTLKNLEVGDRLSGQVTNLTDFGAFVDLGGIEGLVHISELSWGRVEHPSQIVKPGDTAEVLVIHVDKENERIGLSCKRLYKNPWENLEERYHVGQIVTGTVSNIVQFGVFVLLERGLEGLVHVSELAEGNFLHPRNVVKTGQILSAKVIVVNGVERRLALSLRDLHSSQD